MPSLSPTDLQTELSFVFVPLLAGLNFPAKLVLPISYLPLSLWGARIGFCRISTGGGAYLGARGNELCL